MIFIDKWGLVPGRDYVEALDFQVSNCKAAILVVSETSVQSGWVKEEYLKLKRRKVGDESFPLIPIILSDVSMELPFIGSIHYVDFRKRVSYREAFARLLCGLKGEPPGSDPYFNGPLQIDHAEVDQTIAAEPSQATHTPGEATEKPRA